MNRCRITKSSVKLVSARIISRIKREEKKMEENTEKQEQKTHEAHRQF